jgi:membrane-associated protease RseP (regulator of RpoE activity)
MLSTTAIKPTPFHRANTIRSRGRPPPRHGTRVDAGFIATLGVLSTASIVHELGHLARAKHVGAKIEHVSIGIGPILAAFQDPAGVPYILHAFPFGGRVVFGDDFNDTSGFDRATVHLAGPVANIVFAAFLSLAFLVSHDHVIVDDGVRVDRVVTGGAAAAAGLMESDIITSVNGIPVTADEMSYRLVAEELAQAPELELELTRHGAAYVTTLEPREGRTGFELKPNERVEEIMDLRDVPGLVAEDLRLSIDSMALTVRDLVTFSNSPKPVRPEMLLASPLYVTELVNINFCLFNLLMPLLDGWKAGGALVDHLIFSLLEQNEHDEV